MTKPAIPVFRSTIKQRKKENDIEHILETISKKGKEKMYKRLKNLSKKMKNSDEATIGGETSKTENALQLGENSTKPN